MLQLRIVNKCDPKLWKVKKCEFAKKNAVAAL